MSGLEHHIIYALQAFPVWTCDVIEVTNITDMYKGSKIKIKIVKRDIEIWVNKTELYIHLRKIRNGIFEICIEAEDCKCELPYKWFTYFEGIEVLYDDRMNNNAFEYLYKILKCIKPSILHVEMLPNNSLNILECANALIIPLHRAYEYFTQDSPRSKEIEILTWISSESELQLLKDLVKHKIHKSNRVSIYIEEFNIHITKAGIDKYMDHIPAICKNNCIKEITINEKVDFQAPVKKQLVKPEEIKFLQNFQGLEAVLCGKTALTDHTLADPRLCEYIGSFLCK